MQIIMVFENKNPLFLTFGMVFPNSKIFNNSQKLSVVSLIASFYKNYFSKRKNNQSLNILVKIILESSLTKNFTNVIAKYINFNSNIIF